ncbi:YncE family protein [Streptomyces buecherae]|uniref:YncE family protein n=2 Tax=Streptomyces TaxID=1883 RepID=UPI001C25DBAC|nr:YncE family protein [Streptomyces buecherae]
METAHMETVRPETARTRDTRTTLRRTLLATTALAALAVPVTLTPASADGAGARHGAVPEFGAYDGLVDGKRMPFDGTINNNAMAISPDERTAVVTASGFDHVRLVDLRDGHTIKRINGYVTPRNVLFAPDGGSFIVSDSTLGVVDRIAVGTFRVTHRLPLGAGVFGTAQSRDGRRLFANNQAAGTVTEVDQTTRRAVPNGVISGFDHPRQGVKLAPAEDRLFVTNYGDGRTGTISIVDVTTTTDRPKPVDITGFAGVRGLSVSRDGKRLYAANSADDSISFVTLGQHIEHVKHPVGEGKAPYGAVLSPDESVLFVGNLQDSTVTAMDPVTGRGADLRDERHLLKGPRQAITFSSDSRTAWVLNEDLAIAVVDVASRTVTHTLGTPHEPPPSPRR